MLKHQGVKPSDSILDYGCGAGVFLDFLKENGFTNLTGYDPFIGKYSDQSVLGNKFDVVTSYDVIEHVEDPVTYLADLIELVKLHGKLVLGTPNADHIPITNKPPFPVELSQPYHRHIFSEKALTELATNNGLEVSNIYRRFYFDTLIPGVNTRFMWEYINASGGHLETCVEPPNNKLVWSSPKLIFFALFGYFFPARGNILLTLHKTKVIKGRLRANE
jgi:SAM-dependent methyltransferase